MYYAEALDEQSEALKKEIEVLKRSKVAEERKYAELERGAWSDARAKRLSDADYASRCSDTCAVCFAGLDTRQDRIKDDEQLIARLESNIQQALRDVESARRALSEVPSPHLNDTTTLTLPPNSGYAFLRTKAALMAAARQNGNMCGVTAELGLVEAADVARCLEQVLGGRMHNVFLSKFAMLRQLEARVPANSDITELRALDERRWANQRANGPCKPGPNPQYTLELNARIEAAANRYNCLGFAVNLVYIETEPNWLRRGVFFPLLRNTLVFSTKVLEQEAAATVRAPSAKLTVGVSPLMLAG